MKTKLLGSSYLVFNRSEWLSDTTMFKFTEEDLDNADEDGFIMSRFGINCYLSRPIKAI
jgi:hypothetical protein